MPSIARTPRAADRVGGPSGLVRLSEAGHRVRTLIASVITVGLAVAAHIAGAGMAPPAAVLLPVVAAVWAVAHWLAQRRIRSWQWLLLLGGAQAAVHTLSSLVGMSHGAAVDPVVMTAAHVVSTVVTAAVLGFGERVWWQIRAWLLRRLASAIRLPRPRYRASWAIAIDDAPARAWVGAGSVGMRAPPATATL